jgi:hypothetical protein
MLRSELEEHMEDAEALGIPGANSAIIGMARIPKEGSTVAVYDRRKLVEWFMKTEGWDYETADEWVSFNCEGAYVGPGTPLFCDVIEEDECNSESSTPA